MHTRVRRALAMTALAAMLGLAVPSLAGAGINNFDLSFSVTNGVSSVVAGTTTTYTLTISNEGPDAATGQFAPDFTGDGTIGDWTCVASAGGTCSATGSGPISDAFTVPDDGTVTYTVPFAVDADAAGTIVVSDTVSILGDNDDGNDSASDEDPIEHEGDLSITKTDGQTTVSPGEEVTYDIDVANAGPSEVDATVIDDLPSSFTGISWTCTGSGGATCGATEGTGDVSVGGSTLPPGGALELTVTGTLDQSPGGTVVNTATVATEGDATDDDPSNNSATDTDIVVPEADLAITKTDGVTTVKQGSEVTYTIIASNAGPADTTATVTDTLPAGLSDASWTCAGSDGGVCGSPDGTGNLSDGPTLPAGGEVIYTLTATLAEDATGSLVNTAAVAGADDDPTPGNNTATDTDTIAELVSDLVIDKDLEGTLLDGEDATYAITVTNEGPDTALGPIVVTDDLPSGLDFVSATGTGWDCDEDGGLVTCTHDGDLAADATSTITLVATVTAEEGTAIVNTAQVLGESVEADDANNDDAAGATVAADTEAPGTGGTTLPITGWPLDDTLRVALAALGLGLLALGGRFVLHRQP